MPLKNQIQIVNKVLNIISNRGIIEPNKIIVLDKRIILEWYKYDEKLNPLWSQIYQVEASIEDSKVHIGIYWYAAYGGYFDENRDYDFEYSLNINQFENDIENFINE